MEISKIANRVYTETVNLLNSKTPTFYDLSYLSVINVFGDNALNFLQGQLSADITKVNESTIRQSALCNLKGRVLALMDVIYWDGYKLILPSDLCEEIIHSLSMAAKLSRITLEIDKQCKIMGLHNPEKIPSSFFTIPSHKYHSIASDNFFCYGIEDDSFILLTKNKGAELPSLHGSLEWHRLLLERKHIEIYPQSSGLFLPHRLDLHLSGYLNFEKGCYKGQEIIARMQYRGKQKHQLKIISIQTKKTPSIGMKLFGSENKNEVGELIDFCPLGKDRYLIAVSILFDHSETLFSGDDEVLLVLN